MKIWIFDRHVYHDFFQRDVFLSFQMYISTHCDRVKPGRVGGNTSFMVIYITKVLLFWFFHLIFNFFVQDGDKKKMTRSAVTERKISDFFKCHVKFQETKFRLRNHRGRCFYDHSRERCANVVFLPPKTSKKWLCDSDRPEPAGLILDLGPLFLARARARIDWLTDSGNGLKWSVDFTVLYNTNARK